VPIHMKLGFFWTVPSLAFPYVGNNLSPTSWKHLPFGTVLTSSAADLSTHLHITFGVAITPPTSVEPEAGLRGRPVQSAADKSQRKISYVVLLCNVVVHLFYDCFSKEKRFWTDCKGRV